MKNIIEQLEVWKKNMSQEASNRDANLDVDTIRLQSTSFRQDGAIECVQLDEPPGMRSEKSETYISASDAESVPSKNPPGDQWAGKCTLWMKRLAIVLGIVALHVVMQVAIYFILEYFSTTSGKNA